MFVLVFLSVCMHSCICACVSQCLYGLLCLCLYLVFVWTLVLVLVFFRHLVGNVSKLLLYLSSKN